MPSAGSTTLLLLPTDLERQRFDDHGRLAPGLALVEICGFGPIAAAARTAELLSIHRHARVLLAGIAGTYDPDLCPVGSALEFDEVAIDGVGVGEGRQLLAPPALGFPQWPGETHGREPIHDRLALASTPSGSPRLLLTTCAASASRAGAEIRRERFPAALAEDMEGFAVATACALAGAPLRIVRGISNAVGDRDPARWRIPAALAAARLAVLEILASPAPWRH
jgi:futalosine hydrolase